MSSRSISGWITKAGLRFSVALVMLSKVGTAFGTPCADLGRIELAKTQIVLAQMVKPGAFRPPPSGAPDPLAAPAALNPFGALPAFCRVIGVIHAAADSSIRFEVWLPIVSNWNGRYLGVGNGGWGGTITYSMAPQLAGTQLSLASALARGFAVASTDTGHVGSLLDSSFALGHPEKLIDFGYRAVHEMTLDAKAIIEAYYGFGPKFSYWEGCSTGGKQGLMEAQRFPSDYDGIAAGAPSNYWTHLPAAIVWEVKAARGVLTTDSLGLLHAAVLRTCVMSAGVRSGVLLDPSGCRFDPAVLACASGQHEQCLSALQVTAAQKVYAGPSNPRTGRSVYPGLMPGSELGWSDFLYGPIPLGISASFFGNVVFKEARWDFRTLNFDQDVAEADRYAPTLNAVNPNLRAFFRRGGKLLQFHGWADPQISPRNSINYYQSVSAAEGGSAAIQDEYRLFMIPGMGHCGGGDGANSFDTVSALERWVEAGDAPAALATSRLTNGTAMPFATVCAYGHRCAAQ